MRLQLAQSLLKEGPVDGMLLEAFPSLVGAGKPLSPVKPGPDHLSDEAKTGAPGRHDFRLLDTRPLPDGTVSLHCARRRP